MGMYPRINFNGVMGSDAAGKSAVGFEDNHYTPYRASSGTVVAVADEGDALLGKRVFLIPLQGWTDGPPPYAPMIISM
jgi:hypothetical protein